MDFDSLATISFDYVICGGGTAGCVLASRLAAIPNVSVLLIEAGRDSGVKADVLVPGMYIDQLQNDGEGLWKIPTVPQKELNGRELLFLRGRQLGGSSAVNYMAMARGPAADYDHWAKITGDQSWEWNHVLPMMRELEDFRPIPPPGMEHFAQADVSAHGTGGPISIGFGDIMVPGAETFIKACLDAGIPLCPDNNAGNPVGIGLAQTNVGNGERSYAANGFLNDSFRAVTPNLKIIFDTLVDRVVFDGKKAVGVDIYHQALGHSVRVKCDEEVLLCCGTFGSPQILLLSGIGPLPILSDHNIPVIKELPGVGQNMLDHSILTLEYLLHPQPCPDHAQLFLSPSLLSAAKAEYALTKTGPLAIFGSSSVVAFPKLPLLYSSPEFAQLSPEIKEYMLEPTRPSAEIWLGSGPAAYTGGKDGEVGEGLREEDSYMTHELLLQNNLSRGSVTLRSSNPRDAVVVDPNFLSHPFDRRIAIETVREAARLAKGSSYDGVVRKMVHGPKADATDEGILEFVRGNLGQGYHSMGTCKMGKIGDEKAVVDEKFRVMGVEGLRVADLSVCPVLTCNHTQINVYLIAEKCATDIILTRDVARDADSKYSRGKGQDIGGLEETLKEARL